MVDFLLNMAILVNEHKNKRKSFLRKYKLYYEMYKVCIRKQRLPGVILKSQQLVLPWLPPPPGKLLKIYKKFRMKIVTIGTFTS